MKSLYLQLMERLAIPMKQWKPYSLTHLEVTLVVLALALAFAFLFSKTKVARGGVITVFGVLLLLMEVVKQCLLTYVLGYYSWSDFPWQLCSIPMYVCLFFPSFKHHRDTAENFIMVFGFMGGIAAFLVPESSFYAYWVLTLQSVAWHGILLMLSFYMMMGRSKSRSVRAYRSVAIWYLIAAAVAVVIDYLTKDISKGEANLFFIGPSSPRVPILQTIYQVHGWIVETVLMILASLAVGFVVYFVSGMGKRR